MYSDQDNFDVVSQKYFLIYDLETTQLNFFGQILSISFLLTDEFFNPLPGYQKTFVGKVSVLELPDPEAIYANQININIIQENGLLEYDLVQNIYHFINKCISDFGPYNIKLTAHNGSNFDMVFLRTVLIRNGFNPYFKIEYLDSIHLLKVISITHPEVIPYDNEAKKWVLNLNSVAKHLLKTTQEQAHDSEQDVLLLSRVLAKLREILAESLWNIELFYTPIDYSAPFIVMERNLIEDDTNGSETPPLKKKPCLALSHQNNSYLLVDLEKFAGDDDKKVIFYKNKKSNFLKIDYQTPLTEDIIKKGAAAREVLGHWNVSNFFDKSNCDIEQDIYRLGLDGAKNISQFKDIKKKHLPLSVIQDPDLYALWTRFNLKRFADPYLGCNNKDDDIQARYDNVLSEYAKKRYIDRFKLNKQPLEEDKYSKTYLELQERLAELIAEAPKEKLDSLLVLQEFYRNAYITRFLN